MATLDEFESRLQSLLEVHLVKHLPGYRAEDGISQLLAITLHAHLREAAGRTQAPNLFVIVAHPSTLSRWQAKPRLLKELANALFTAGKEAGFQFSHKPTVTTTADAGLPADDLRIIASFSEENVAETQGISAGGLQDHAPGASPGNAFLIVGGTQVVPLDQFVTNIGRRLNNHIILDDPRVSRTHAQLRIVREHYMLFDLNSSGGTFVNGQRINQSILHPGDVISLAGVSLIFGHDMPADAVPDEGQTEPRVSNSSGNNETNHQDENRQKS
jgi:hypothetical protein